MNYVYIITNKPQGTLYVGVTSNLVKRIYEHKNNFVDGFTKKYNLHTLVYFEETKDIYQALTTEKRLKKWNRAWKIELVNKFNPTWRDLYPDIIG